MSGDKDGMSEPEDEEETSMRLDDERKLMRSVLSHFDDGAAATGRQNAEPAEEVGAAHFADTAVLTVMQCLITKCPFWVASCQILKT